MVLDNEIEDVLKEFRHLCRDHEIHNHPYFRAIRDASMRAAAVRAWALQDYHVSRQFPCLAAVIASRIEDPRLRHPLVINLWEEHGEGRFEASHISFFGRLLASIGVSEDEVTSPLPATSNFISGQMRLAEEDVLSGLGAFCYGNELLSLWEFRPIEEACAQAFPGADLSYFRANREADGRHSRDAELVILSLCKSRAAVQSVRRGAEWALHARFEFYDGIMQQLNNPSG
jgi:pyrroloquinoline-quinone synthase